MIDFHVHSNISDGSSTPAEIIQMALNRGLYAVALTDHDSVAGLREAELEAEKYHLKFLKGIELSVAYGKGRLLHILGIGINPENETFLKVYKRLRASREGELERILHILKQQGISIHSDELQAYKAGQYLDRQAIAKYCTDKKICRSVPEVWQKYLDTIPYAACELLEADEALDMIKKSGGLSFLAHYTKRIGLEGYTDYEKEEHIKYLAALGLDGIERYYPSFSSKQTAYADYLIDKYQLILSGGTDFHGTNRPEIALGIGEGDFCVPDSIYEEMLPRLTNGVSA